MSDCTTPEALVVRILALEKALEKHREYVESMMDEKENRYMVLFASHREATELAISASERAVSKSEGAIDRRFDQVNEFRGAMADLVETMLPKEEYARYHDLLVEKTEANARSIERMQGASAGTLRMVSWAVLVFGGTIAAISLIVDFIAGH